MHPHVRAHHWARMFENRHKSGDISSDDSLDTPDPPHSRTEDEPVPPKQDNGMEEGGVTDEDLWMLIRRFNKEIYHVKSPRNALPHELDLSRSSEDHFSPEKLRTTLEWFYTSVVVDVTNAWYHITWIRSWREPRRTGALCSVYFMAWLLDALTFLFTITPAILILFPSLQPFLFPADPASELASKGENGGPHRRDSLTGASESHKGEAAEREAQNLVWDIAEVALDSARTEVDDQGTLEDAAQAPHGKKGIARERLPVQEDETAQPMMEKVSKALVQAIRIISDITETYERFCNLLSPTPPFYLVNARLRVVSILVLWALCSLFIPSYWLIKSTAFLFGLLFFGEPLFQRSFVWMNYRFPHWKEEFDINETLLKDVPTNAQLTLTLLRLGEMTSSPLSPPPRPLGKSPSTTKSREKPLVIPPAEALVLDASGLPFPGILKLVRFTIGVGIGLRQAFHRAIAVAGMPHPPHLIGLLRKRGWVSAAVGPLKFRAQFDHQRGTAVIDSSLEPPVLYFTTHQPSRVQDLRLSHQHKGSILFRIPVPDIAELKKTEELGWKQKLILEITGGVSYSVDGLMVCGKESDQCFHLMAMKERDQLFNRLVAMGAQFWESC